MPPAGKAQRPFREAKGDRIAAEFDINSFGFPVVCRVDKTNWLVDGQHRTYAIQKCGYAQASDTIECEVYEGLSIAQMAQILLGRNRSTPATVFERFSVAVTAGYPTERAITKIVESIGLKIGYPKTQGNVYSVGALLVPPFDAASGVDAVGHGAAEVEVDADLPLPVNADVERRGCLGTERGVRMEVALGRWSSRSPQWASARSAGHASLHSARNEQEASTSKADSGSRRARARWTGRRLEMASRKGTPTAT